MVRLDVSNLGVANYAQRRFNSSMVRLDVATTVTVPVKPYGFNSSMVRLDAAKILVGTAVKVFQFQYGAIGWLLNYSLWVFF